MYEVSSALDSYLSDGSSKPKPYVDPKAVNPGENDVPQGSPHLSTITIKWEDGDSNDRKLERIITQKWIANFPDGEEAWAEYRRSGYPVLFPIVVNHSAGKIPTIPGIRRLHYPTSEYDTNTGGVEAAVGEIGGTDTGAPRWWWDVEDKSAKYNGEVHQKVSPSLTPPVFGVIKGIKLGSFIPFFIKDNN